MCPEARLALATASERIARIAPASHPFLRDAVGCTDVLRRSWGMKGASARDCQSNTRTRFATRTSIGPHRHIYRRSSLRREIGRCGEHVLVLGYVVALSGLGLDLWPGTLQGTIDMRTNAMAMARRAERSGPEQAALASVARAAPHASEHHRMNPSVRLALASSRRHTQARLTARWDRKTLCP
jgi:hypothetical protein